MIYVITNFDEEVNCVLLHRKIIDLESLEREYNKLVPRYKLRGENFDEWKKRLVKTANKLIKSKKKYLNNCYIQWLIETHKFKKLKFKRGFTYQ